MTVVKNKIMDELPLELNNVVTFLHIMRSYSGDIIELRVPSRPEYISIIRSFVTDIAQRMAFSKTAVEDVQVSISEACTNVVHHAYPSAESEFNEILIRFISSDDQLVMEVIDTGDGFRGSSIRSTCASKRNGFGLILIRQLMDHVSLDTSTEHGTHIRMIKRLRLTDSSHSDKIGNRSQAEYHLS